MSADPLSYTYIIITRPNNPFRKMSVFPLLPQGRAGGVS